MTCARIEQFCKKCRMKTNLTCSNAKNLKNVETVTSFPSFFLTNAFNK